MVILSGQIKIKKPLIDTNSVFFFAETFCEIGNFPKLLRRLCPHFQTTEHSISIWHKYLSDICVYIQIDVLAFFFLLPSVAVVRLNWDPETGGMDIGILLILLR